MTLPSQQKLDGEFATSCRVSQKGQIRVRRVSVSVELKY